MLVLLVPGVGMGGVGPVVVHRTYLVSLSGAMIEGWLAWVS